MPSRADLIRRVPQAPAVKREHPGVRIGNGHHLARQFPRKAAEVESAGGLPCRWATPAACRCLAARRRSIGCLPSISRPSIG
jgi:hypothetical protein